ncbi:pyridoxamine 5'-phosphate oxidase family protein [Lactobacillus psittaci]|uniref:Pyridoxamine 5'-phosphate oxidase N-terminal domain-containing protein n=1 Tax=Lactobacillus psittaci DSM 15354 TaxID=1122152 RepID=A0A0R1S147_9LACO|nr:pyridoxamine 5'-phosphate oxidase family protein [Lactobacillus psittaci]KRL62796.1 hypothetical protein FC23_GL001267 [Lactobacillus psittaci DSM 15354]
MKKLDSVKLTEDQQKFFEEKLAFVSSVDKDGNPQVGPKGSLNVLDESHLAWVEVTHAHLWDNIHNGSKVAVVVADVPSHTNVRVIGSVHVSDDKELAEAQYKKTGKTSGDVVIVDIEEIDA